LITSYVTINLECCTPILQHIIHKTPFVVVVLMVVIVEIIVRFDVM
jgi:hypothetical protein